MKEKGKFEQVILAISQKDVTEAIFKNLSAFFACAALLRYCTNAAMAHDIPFAISSFFVLVVLISINFIYSINHIIIPIEKALPQKKEKPIPDEVSRIREIIVLMLTKASGVVYLMFSCGFSWFVFRLVDYVAKTK
ncbi:hypothetical protein OL229_03615 [Neisseriaceae bacterium JH1-16]|nr:hypothetical protein [Neisseriaceae bacterium JH1-16]